MTRASPIARRDVLARLSLAGLASAGLASAGLPLATALFPLRAHASVERLLAPGKDLWPRWQASNESATETVDHTTLGLFLNRYLGLGGDGITRLAYAKVSTSDRAALIAYTQRLGRTAVSRLSRAEQLPLWINLYNALTITVVLEKYPVASIRDIDISPGLFASGPWGKKLVTVEGEGVTLNDIEHRILRPIWADPRLHYALNCASLGCPNLRPQPFTATTTQALLTDGARAYVNHRRGARIENGRLVASKIYDWFREDFGGSDEGVIAHLAQFAEPPLAAALAGRRSIDDHEYDWRLNDAAA